MLTTKIMGAGGTIGGIVPPVTSSIDATYTLWDINTTLDVLSIADEGDLVVLAISADFAGQSLSLGGMTFTAVTNTFGTGSNSPAVYVGYTVVQAGDSNPYPNTTGADAIGRGVSIVAVAIPGASTYVDYTSSTGNSSSLNPGGLTASADYWLFTAHVDDDAGVEFTPPSGYTLAGSATFPATQFGASATAIAIKVASLTSETPGDMTYTTVDDASDAWGAHLLAFT